MYSKRELSNYNLYGFKYIYYIKRAHYYLNAMIYRRVTILLLSFKGIGTLRCSWYSNF